MNKLRKDLFSLKDSKKAKSLSKYFKTGKGEYGEGDIFLGISVPDVRKVALNNLNLDFKELEKNLSSEYHEERLASLLVLVEKYISSGKDKKFVDFYLKNLDGVNNWDLVDSSADDILGDFIYNNPQYKKIIYELVKSENLWKRRISIISTFHLIKNNSFEDSLKISKILLSDEHDLIHKAVGWMLREIGKKDLEKLENFIVENYSKMPRTTLRYSIERFPENKRKKFLRGEFNEKN